MGIPFLARSIMSLTRVYTSWCESKFPVMCGLQMSTSSLIVGNLSISTFRLWSQSTNSSSVVREMRSVVPMSSLFNCFVWDNEISVTLLNQRKCYEGSLRSWLICFTNCVCSSFKCSKVCLFLLRKVVANSIALASPFEMSYRGIIVER